MFFHFSNTEELRPTSGRAGAGCGRSARPVRRGERGESPVPTSIGVRSVAHSLYRSLPIRRSPRRWNPTFLYSVQNLHLPFASVRVIRGSISSSRRWRQVGRPRRVSPTSFTDNRQLTTDLFISGLRSQVSALSSSSTYHAGGDKWADRGGSALPSFILFKFFIFLSRPFA